MELAEKDLPCMQEDADHPHRDWESREAEIMKEVDAGSRGPWLLQDEFQLDFDSYYMIMSRLSSLKKLV